MPSQVNGVGTSYFGSQDDNRYDGTCQGCGALGELRDYTTRLWFTFLFIPLIPLKRYRVLAYCKRCTRHAQMPLETYLKTRRESLDTAQQAVAEDPDDPTKAMELLGTLNTFALHDKATVVANTLATKFADDPKIQIQLALFHEDNKRSQEATVCWERAAKLDCVDPSVLHVIAMWLIGQGRASEARTKVAGARESQPGDVVLRLAEAEACMASADPAAARELLLEAPPSDVIRVEPAYRADLSALMRLGLAYQKAQQHDQALDTFALLLREAPGVGRDKEFRGVVLESETAIGRTQSILPRVSLLGSKPVLALVAAVFLAVAAFAVDVYVAGHRTVHVINGSEQPATVTFDGGSSVTVGTGGRVEVGLAEGDHAVAVRAGDHSSDVRFTIPEGFWERWFGQQVLVLNAGQAAVIMWERTAYSQNPNDTLNAYTFHFDQPFMVFSDVDFAFEEFPERISVSSSQRSSVTKERIVYVAGHPVELLGQFPQ
ncbi:hypothetical protein OAX78_00800, partial [Planctomycetota bacterium]|nr:hypothetical protein [Planctomycetota bacterium]